MRVCRPGLGVDPLGLALLRHARKLRRVGLRAGPLLPEGSAEPLDACVGARRGVGELPERELNHLLLELVHLVDGAALDVLADVAAAIGLDNHEVALRESQRRVLAEEEVLAAGLEADDAERRVGRDGVQGDTAAEVHVVLRLRRERRRTGRGRQVRDGRRGRGRVEVTRRGLRHLRLRLLVMMLRHVRRREPLRGRRGLPKGGEGRRQVRGRRELRREARQAAGRERAIRGLRRRVVRVLSGRRR